MTGGLRTEPAQVPGRICLTGTRVRIVPLDPDAHSDSLHGAACGSANDELWRYLSDGPFANREAFDDSLRRKAASSDPLFFAILDAVSGLVIGQAAYLRIEPVHRVIEVGHILFAPQLQKTSAATEAMYLMAYYAFENLGYRRYEWKCDARNEASRRAALRLGFQFEGIFRQHMIIKEQNRDTAWYAMLDSDWPRCKSAFEAWLDAGNFDTGGRQKSSLATKRGQHD